MKERGIVFSSPMVRAILDGRKGQTRRLLKDQRVPGLILTTHTGGFEPRRCPHGVPGDRLYVKETYHPAGRMGADEVLIEYKADESEQILYPPPGFMWDKWDDKWIQGPWRSPRFMFRWMSRIRLEITDVRVERLGDITDDDARAEGMTAPVCNRIVADFGRADYRGAFLRQWTELHGEMSPGTWVWVLSFKRIAPPT